MRESADRMRVELARRFPACFVPQGATPKPFAIGIAEQLYACCPDLDRHDLANVLADYTSEASYYQATIAGAERIDLSGAAVGVVTLANENNATAKLRRMARNV
jgi:sRNA-binding protein